MYGQLYSPIMKGYEIFAIVSVATLGLLVGMMSLTSGVIMSAYAAPLNLKFCFSSTAPASPVCSQSEGQCKKTEEYYANLGYTIIEHCHKV
jgi:hypothetical protein